MRCVESCSKLTLRHWNLKVKILRMGLLFWLKIAIYSIIFILITSLLFSFLIGIYTVEFQRTEWYLLVLFVQSIWVLEKNWIQVSPPLPSSLNDGLVWPHFLTLKKIELNWVPTFLSFYHRELSALDPLARFPSVPCPLTSSYII